MQLRLEGRTISHLSLCFLGPVRILRDAELATGFKSNKVRALLIYLAMEAGRPHAREVLAGLLWPDVPDRVALSNLRFALSNLREAIGDRSASPPFLTITREMIEFNVAADCQVDVAAFHRYLAEARRLPSSQVALDYLKQAVTLYQGRFLEGFSADSPIFEEWALLQQEELGQEMVQALYDLAGLLEEQGDYRQALDYARRALDLEPWEEEAHRQVMRLLALDGRRSAALAQYATCRRALAEALGVGPSAETTALYEEIRLVGRPRTAGDEPGIPRDDGQAAGIHPALSLGPEPRFVARERELAQLQHFLELACAGQGCVVFVTGDPGSGKTALVQEFVCRAMEARRDVVAAFGKGNAHTGIGDPYLPFLEILRTLVGDFNASQPAGVINGEHARRLLARFPFAVQVLLENGPDLVDRFVRGESLLRHARAFAARGRVLLDPEKASFLARLEALVTERPAAAASVLQADLFGQYTRVLQALSRQQVLILMLDDLQWADTGSISLLFHLGRRLAGSRILVVCAYRPADLAPSPSGERHPLELVVHELQREFADAVIDLSQAESRQFVDQLLDAEPNRLGTAFRDTLYRHTGGNPLFTVELLRGLQERGDLVRGAEGRWVEGAQLDWDRLPARVEAVIAERISRVPQPWRAALAVASVEGDEFIAEVVARVLGMEEQVLLRSLSGELSKVQRLVSARMLSRLEGQRLSHYGFRHFLFQKYLYQQLDGVERAQLHEAVGNALEALYGDQAGEMAVQLAWHFQAAGLPARAVGYLLQAGSRAERIAAYPEAIAHLRRGRELLETLPDTPERAQQELAVLFALGPALQAARGYTDPESGAVYSRARELCLQLGDIAHLVPSMLSLSSYYFMRGDFAQMHALEEEGVRLVEQLGDPLSTALAHWALGSGRMYAGKLAEARQHLDRFLAFYDRKQHGSLAQAVGNDLEVVALADKALVLGLQGYPDQARRCSRASVELARELNHAYSLCFALGFAGPFYFLLGDTQAVEESHRLLRQVATEKGIAFYQASAELQSGWLQVQAGQAESAIETLRRTLQAFQTSGERAHNSLVMAWLAYAYARAGRIGEALDCVDEALVEAARGVHCWEAELYRMKGEYLLDRQGRPLHSVAWGPATDDAEACFQQSIVLARDQGARWFELRTTVSLARLWQAQGRGDEARRALAEIYGWFTEGFDTPDLREAKRVMVVLS